MRRHLKGHLNDKEPVLQRPTERAGPREQHMEKTYGGHEPGKEKAYATRASLSDRNII